MEEVTTICDNCGSYRSVDDEYNVETCPVCGDDEYNIITAKQVFEEMYGNPNPGQGGGDRYGN